jgi:phenylacetic acid degradation operon negative regulatory protein
VRGESTERTSGARALLYSVLGEFVLPAGGSAWTSTLLTVCELCGVTEKNARQALARLGEQGRIEPQRHGRHVRWHLTTSGERLLRDGATRIYEFGAERDVWDGEWLVAHCPVPESRRAVRARWRTQLAFQGFGELSASLVVSPRVEREAALRSIAADLELAELVIWRARTASAAEDGDLAARAWDLAALAEAYEAFGSTFERPRPQDDMSKFVATLDLVHAWRRFPFLDAELPRELLPRDWVGRRAAELFHARRNEWSEGSHRWFRDEDTKIDPDDGRGPSTYAVGVA